MDTIALNFEELQETSFPGIQGRIRFFQDDVSGLGAICRVVQDMLDGKVKTATFITAKFGEAGGWFKTGTFTFTYGTFEGKPCFQWGIGESSIVATWYPDCCDKARVVGTIVANYGCNVFRARTVPQV
ncbi:MAG TPA: hypothetical protein PLV96_06510 [Methanoregulaceae archaeon]|jgi:hypothetical protein|nr:hypothetical protein [Methanoregulaceae archaeon]HQN17714.1 hypothetical protein [Syntrophobacteraceae bacterium]